MKSYNILDKKFQMKKGSNDKDLNSRINLIFCEIFEKYESLDEESIKNIRDYIYTFFSKLRPTKCKEKEYISQLNNLLYPHIYFVGLAHLYSNDGYIQYSFLLKVNDEINKELNKNIKNKEKIK